MMCIFRSLFDEFQGKIAASWTHMYAATQMIRRRGGPDALRNNPIVTLVANCYGYRTRGYMQGTTLAYMSYPDLRHNFLDSEDRDLEEVALVREELIEFCTTSKNFRSQTRARISLVVSPYSSQAVSSTQL